MVQIVSYTTRLREQLNCIQSQFMSLLDSSVIKEFHNAPDSQLIFIGPGYYWGELNDEQKRLQMQLLKDYKSWLDHFVLLFNESPKSIRNEIQETNKFVSSWIERDSSWGIPASVTKAKDILKDKLEVFYKLFGWLDGAGPHELVLIPDTNIFIADTDVSRFAKTVGQDKYTVVIVPTVLEELDKLKMQNRTPDFLKKVERAIRWIKGLRQQGNLTTGVTVNKSITLKAMAKEPDFRHTLSWLDYNIKDDRIIATSMELQRLYPTSIVTIVTTDINLQNKADFANLPYLEPV